MPLKWLLNFGFTQVMGKSPEVVLNSKEEYPNGFQLPLHYPNYKKEDYEKMEEWRLDLLLKEYGITLKGSLDDKRNFAMGAFLWPHQF
ncbi:hypothetical protein CsatB_013399 [Cannabis sativa]|uniref:DUF7722 domain-containing protein n=2 Tax=Cannabis sativa TaxID=3483 RepID=A0AB40E8F3_CANSA|nr:uncharacterized protein LOC115725657 [Cannabis sativa]KAF4362255.1 hypothetical protein F8388_008139 [Cannabis sativa]KAF4391239.1 hypothetical protein G4B88_016549 [Cannabis sativa]